MIGYRRDTHTAKTDYIIGVDFDNTVVTYDEIMHRMAVQRGLMKPDGKMAKKEIRDRIRKLPNGELEWQRLQGIVYGPRMEEARLIDGVRPFFEDCKRYKVSVYIIGHKAEYAGIDQTKTNLKLAAVDWMRKNGCFEANGLGISREDVYFESTRSEKIERISNLKCTHFIDDLEETFLEDSFPLGVNKILYAPQGTQQSTLQGLQVVNTWEEIKDYFFDGRS